VKFDAHAARFESQEAGTRGGMGMVGCCGGGFGVASAVHQVPTEVTVLAPPRFHDAERSRGIAHPRVGLLRR